MNYLFRRGMMLIFEYYWISSIDCQRFTVKGNICSSVIHFSGKFISLFLFLSRLSLIVPGGCVQSHSLLGCVSPLIVPRVACYHIPYWVVCLRLLYPFADYRFFCHLSAACLMLAACPPRTPPHQVDQMRC